MAYVTVTARGGTDEERGRLQDALVSHFEDAWGEIAVELTHDGACWRVDVAWWKVAGASLRQDCRDQVASALSMAHIAFRRPLDPASPPSDPRAKLW